MLSPGVRPGHPAAGDSAQGRSGGLVGTCAAAQGVGRLTALSSGHELCRVRWVLGNRLLLQKGALQGWLQGCLRLSSLGPGTGGALIRKMGTRKDVVVVVGLLSSAACVLVYLWEACMGWRWRPGRSLLAVNSSKGVEGGRGGVQGRVGVNNRSVLVMSPLSFLPE